MNGPGTRVDRVWNYFFIYTIKAFIFLQNNYKSSVYVEKLEAQPTEPVFGLSLYRSHDNRMILKQISKGDNHYLKKQQPFWMEGGAVGHNFERDTPRDHLCQVVSEEKIFLTLANQKKELILAAMFVGRMEPNEEAL